MTATHARRTAMANLTAVLTLLTCATYAEDPAGNEPSGSPASAQGTAALLFERDVLPILTAHCFKCHGLEARKAGLDLRSVGLMLRGGENGPVLIKGDAHKSSLFERINDRSMPPEGELPLTDDAIAVIRRWVDAGAPADAAEELSLDSAAPPLVTDEERAYWAFQKPRRVPIPQVAGRHRVRTPVDAFLLAHMEPESLSFSGDADRTTLVRRLYLDVIGLPPEPDQVEAFVSDDAPGSYVRLVDRLLESPHFGERWGRHWLDAVGYADTIGDDTDAGITKVAAGKWRFRDYVISAFNADKPYDRFLVEQFAGDELFDWRSSESYTPQQQELLVATGFLRMAPDETLQGELNTADIRHAILQRTMETALGSVTALTITCARCHTHKFDPIPQEDYYRLLSAFTPAFNPQSWLQPGARELPDVPPAEKSRIEQHNGKLDGQINQCREQVTVLRKPYRDRILEERLAELPDNVRSECREAVETPADKRSEQQKALVAQFGEKLEITEEIVAAAMNEADRAQEKSIQQQISELASRRLSWQTIQAVYDVGEPPATYLLRRGNHETPGREVTPGYLRVLCADESEAALSFDSPHPGASGRRLALARWLTEPDAPSGGLVARVFVNRVWQQLFGRGIVATSENFGASGEPPTHPELLDWLASDFVDRGWRIKPLIRMLLMSTAYRQSSVDGRQAAPGESDAGGEQHADPDNTLLWRMPLRPLEAEAVRDSILAVSGQLDTTPFGPPILHAPDDNGMVNIKTEELSTPGRAFRRSVYLLCRRRYHLSLMETFDQPEVAGACLRRSHAPMVAQSLTMLNDPFVIDQSRLFAERVSREAADGTPAAWIDRAFRIALCRPPEAEEVGWSGQLLDRQRERYLPESESPEQAAQRALVHLCAMLLNTSEFLYIR